MLALSTRKQYGFIALTFLAVATIAISNGELSAQGTAANPFTDPNFALYMNLSVRQPGAPNYLNYPYIFGSDKSPLQISNLGATPETIKVGYLGLMSLTNTDAVLKNLDTIIQRTMINEPTTTYDALFGMRLKAPNNTQTSNTQTTTGTLSITTAPPVKNVLPPADTVITAGTVCVSGLIAYGKIDGDLSAFARGTFPGSTTRTTASLTTSGSITSTGTLNINGSGSSGGILDLHGGAVVDNSTTGLTMSGVGSLTLNASNTYSGATTVAGGTLLVNGDSGSSGTLLINGVGNVTLSGNGSILQSGTGTMRIVGSNTYTGITSINTGTLATGSGTINLNGGVLTLDNSNSLGSTGCVVSTNVSDTLFLNGLSGATLDVSGSAGSLQVTGGTGIATLNGALVVNGAGNLTKIGSGTLTLATGNTLNSYTGTTNIANGILGIVGGAASDTSASLIVNAGTHTVGNITGNASTVVVNGGDLLADSVIAKTLTIGTGATVTISPIAGGLIPSGGLTVVSSIPSGPLTGSLTAVPEPGILVLLISAALGLAAAAWRKRRV